MIERKITERELKTLAKANKGSVSVMPDLIEGYRKYMVTNKAILLFVDEVPDGYKNGVNPIDNAINKAQEMVLDIMKRHSDDEILDKVEIVEGYDTIISDGKDRLMMFRSDKTGKIVWLNAMYKKFFVQKDYVLNYCQNNHLIKIEEVGYDVPDLVGYIMPCLPGEVSYPGETEKQTTTEIHCNVSLAGSSEQEVTEDAVEEDLVPSIPF